MNSDRASATQIINALMMGVFTVMVVAVLACDGSAAPRATPPTAATTADTVTEPAFAADLGVNLDSMTETSSGVYVQDLEVGRGATATAGKVVVVEYRAWLPNGTLFEERPNAEGWGASEFLLGEGAPVPGLILGIVGMRVGGVRRIVVPAEHGYGLVGRPTGVPAGSALVFQVRLTGVRDETAPTSDQAASTRALAVNG